jgi:hypothetical protein
MGSTTTSISNRGYFITPKILSNEVTDNYNKVNLKFSPFTDERDQIILKHRSVDDMNNEQYLSSSDWLGTWTSTTTFTTPEDLSGFTADAKTGLYNYEVEFTRGGGSGYMSQITNIQESGGTYTVTIDDPYSYYESGDKGYFVIRNWTIWKTISYGDSVALQGYLNDQIGADGKFIQMKGELRGVRVRIEELLINNKTALPAK